MRFAAEANDEANKGLSIIRDLLHPVQVNNPGISAADLWTAAGANAVSFLGGPEIPFKFGRTDTNDPTKCPRNGLLPDASQGAEHLRDVFYRMGFNDQEIVALSGGHTLGRAHYTRSGYDGPWTHTPLKFNNEYFKNLMNLDWVPRQWKGKFQFEDTASGRLLMLPTDLALKTDPVFSKFARIYADDEAEFFKDFSAAYAKLLALGTPATCNPADNSTAPPLTDRQLASREFREYCMHGSLERVQALERDADVHEPESYSGRTAMHKAAFWGHTDVVDYLIALKLNPNAKDYNGDTPLHDAARFAHEGVVRSLMEAPGVDLSLKNKDGRTALEVAIEYSSTSTANKHDAVIALLRVGSPEPTAAVSTRSTGRGSVQRRGASKRTPPTRRPVPPRHTSRL
jgi:ankyrin repeat protein